MINVLSKHLVKHKEGKAPIMVRPVGMPLEEDALKCFLWDADQVGIVFSTEKEADFLTAMPWSAIQVVHLITS